jgi:hypothetical protein
LYLFRVYHFVASLLQSIVMGEMPWMSNVYTMVLLSATGATLASHTAHEVPGHLGDSRVVLEDKLALLYYRFHVRGVEEGRISLSLRYVPSLLWQGE